MGKTFKAPFSYVLRKGFTVKGLGRQALLLPSSGQCTSPSRDADEVITY